MRTNCIAQGALLKALSRPKGKEIQGRGDTCIRMADSLCCMAETNTL